MAVALIVIAAILMPSGPGAVTDFFTQFAGMQTAVKAARVEG